MDEKIVNNTSVEKSNNPSDNLSKEWKEYHSRRIDYNKYVDSADLSKYEEPFVNFYRKGIIVIKDKEYKVADLYLENGMSMNEQELFLVYYRNPEIDILTNKVKKDFKRTGVVEFRAAYVFYKLFNTYRDGIKDNKLIVNDNNIVNVNDIVRSFDGTLHIETPETSYGRIDRQ